MKIQAKFRNLRILFSTHFKRAVSKGGILVAHLLGNLDKSNVRVPGSAIGQMKISPDFDAPLPEEVIKDFGGGKRP